MAKSEQEKQKLEQKLKQKKTKRGKGKKNRKNKCENKDPLNLSLLGSNSNGLKAKLDSLKNNINIFNQPSCILIQETKLRQLGNIDLPGYQVFQLNRSGEGGGLLSAIDINLDPVLVGVGDDELELLVVQIKVGHLDVRVFNAYGPQEDDTAASLNFWHGLEKEIIKAKQENCCILLEMDANAKLESESRLSSGNGKYMQDMVNRQNLTVLNNSNLCKGRITRHRITKNKEEKFILVCL